VKILAGKADAAKTVGAAGTRRGAHEVRALGAVLALDTVLAQYEGLAVTAVRAVGTADAPNAVVAPHEPFRLLAKGASGASFAVRALHTATVLGIASELAQEFSVLVLEISKC
jgi:hypothetical protein